jgi:predicted nucleic acid-binding protein
MPFVIDASVALAWILPDEQARHALEQLADDVPISSPVWPLEVANGVLGATRRGRLTESEGEVAAARLRSLGVRAHRVSPAEALDGVAALARAHNLSAYDASYLYVAIRERLPLATIDIRLRQAATAAGVPVV